MRIDKKGVVKELPDSQDQILVEVGIMKIKVNMKYVFDASEKDKKLNKKSVVTKTGNLKQNKMASGGFEINVIGLYPSEALEKVDKFIDDALVMNVPVIRVVHGKGAGILRNEIHKMLKENIAVESFRLGEFGEGDSGVTIVTLK